MTPTSQGAPSRFQFHCPAAGTWRAGAPSKKSRRRVFQRDCYRPANAVYAPSQQQQISVVLGCEARCLVELSLLQVAQAFTLPPFMWRNPDIGPPCGGNGERG